MTPIPGRPFGDEPEDSTTSSGWGAGPPELHVLGPGLARRWTLPPRGELTIGRAAGADVHVPNPLVSRRHLVLRVGARIEVEDLGSANGTTVSGATLVPGRPVALRPHDLIAFGDVAAVVLGPRPRRPPLGDDEAPIVLDPAMRRLYAQIERLAATDLSLLLFGETGVGKDVVARHIHRRSPRRRGPFVVVDCGALSGALIESELFGHEEGAFTGARGTRPGLLETAEGGTVFLDEIGELALPLQVKLLRVLETRQLLRVGGVRRRALDVRFVAATHRDLHAAVAAGRFRQDLLYRLSGAELHIPPLRERPLEVRALAERFLAQLAPGLGRPPPHLGEEAAAALAAHDWPGNLRELRHAVERAAVLCGEVITPALLGLGDERFAPPDPAGQASWEKRRRILEALRACDGNQTRAARLLGVSRATLHTWLESHRIPRPRKGPRP